MRKLFTFLLTMVVAMVANAATAPTVQLGEEFKSVAALDGKTFAIVNQAEEKALFGSNNQNLGYDVYSNAFVATNSGYLWKLVSLADNADEEIRGYYLLQLVTPAGADYNCWRMGGVLNSQPTTGSVSFILGLNGAQMGQDIKNGAVYDVQYVEGQGFSLKNIGTGLYQGANTAPAKNEEPTYWSFKQVIVDYSAAVAEVLAEAEPYKALVTDQKALDAFADAVKNLTSETAKSSEDLEKAKAAVAALVKAQTADGANMTGAIVNPSFELGTANGWTYAASDDHGAKENGNATYTMSNNDGKYVFNIYPKGNAISQTIEGLPNGTYKLQAVIATDGGKKVQLNANDKNVQIDATGKETGVEGEVEFEVTDGKATIGAEGVDESWYKVDNFRLTLVKAAAVVPEKDAWFVDDNFRVKDYLGHEDATNEEANVWALSVPRWVADPATDANGCLAVTTNANGDEAHYCQLWYKVASLPLETGSKFTLKFKVKADKEQAIGAQSHVNFAYDGGWMNPFGADINVTTEWQVVEKELEVKSGIGGNVNPGSTDIVFNLSKTKGESNTFYFDEFEVVSKDFQYAEPAWAKAMAYAHMQTTWSGEPAGDANKKCASTPAKLVMSEAEGDAYLEVVADGKTVNNWDNQFFIQIGDACGNPDKNFKSGDKILLKFAAMAVPTEGLEKGATITLGGGQHEFNDGSDWLGSASSITVKVGEWTEYSLEFEMDKANFKNYSLDLCYNAFPVTYRFKNFSAEFTPAPVLSWVDLIPLQDFEAGYTGADDEKLYFFEKEQPISSDATYRARIVDGVGKDGGKAIEFRYSENAEQGWYSQFEIRLPYLLPNGTKIKLYADIKAEKAVSGMGGQVWYNDFGSYRGGIPGYALEADTWYSYEQTITINDNNADDDPKGLRFLVFDGKGGAEANTLYFDNIRVEIPGDQVPAVDPDFLNAKDYPIFEYVDPSTLDWSENILKNGDLSTDDMSAFILKNNDVENPEMLLAEKNQYGEIGIKTAALPAEGGNDYDAQFFVRLPYVLPKGKKFNLEFDLYADKINTLAIAAHGEPGEWKGNMSSVTTNPDPAESSIVHYQKYLSAPADMRTIAFNLAVAKDATYGFSNIKVQIVNDDKAAIEEATATADETTLWAETLALNEACYAGRIAETEGCTEASVKALTDAIAAGKAALAPAEGDPAPTKESLTAAAKAIKDAINALESDAPLADTDLTKEMFFTWTAVDATAEKTTQAGCDYNVGISTGMPYGDGTVNEYNYADLSAYDHLAITATEGEPRLLFNRAAQDDHQGPLSVELPRDYGQNKYEAVVDNGDGSKTYVINLKAIVEKDGYAHLHAIKANGWGSTTTVTEMKLFVGESKYTDVLTGIADVETAGAVKDGKYFINGQIVIVKNGVKYNAAGVAIK